jgi:hypothetical protein
MPKKVSKIHVWMSGMKKKPKLDALLLPKEIEQALPLIPNLYLYIYIYIYIYIYNFYFILFLFIYFLCVFFKI